MASLRLFKRVYKLVVTNLTNNETYTFENLKIGFKITKTKKARGNKAILEAYNISPERRGSISAKSTKDGEPQIRCALYGGFDKEPKLLFNGTGLSSTKWASPDYITTFTLTDDAVSAITTDIFEFAYDKGTSIDTIISDMLGVLGLPTGRLDTIGSSLKRSRSFSGPPTEKLEELASTYGFRFDVQNGRASIIKEGSSDFDDVVVNLNKDSGLIGKPYWEGSIVKASCLVLPEIVPNSIVYIGVKDREIVGPYSVAKMQIKGDNWAGSATMDLELEPRDLVGTYETLIGVGEQLA